MLVYLFLQIYEDVTTIKQTNKLAITSICFVDTHAIFFFLETLCCSISTCVVSLDEKNGDKAPTVAPPLFAHNK